jgi:DNA polymerase-3 subunit alpha
VRDKFLDGYRRNGLDVTKFEAIWDDILACQTYVFNKAHSYAYGYIAYADMYLKTHYPKEFMCAALQTRSREIYVGECQRLGIDVLPPCVNKSDVNYSIQGDAIRLGLSNIKNVGQAKRIMKCRPYTDEFDLMDRGKPGKKVLPALVYSGALDDLDGVDSRSDLAGRLFFNSFDGTDIGQLAQSEKFHLGFYLKMNPLKNYRDSLANCYDPNGQASKSASVGGMVAQLKEYECRTGTMAFLKMLTLGGEIDVVMWPRDYARSKSVVTPGTVILSTGKLTQRGNYAVSNIVKLGEIDVI